MDDVGVLSKFLETGIYEYYRLVRNGHKPTHTCRHD